MRRRRFALIAATLVPLGLATKFYTGPGSEWVMGQAGGSIYVIFWCLLVFVIWPRLSVAPVVSVVFLITAAIEFLQLWHPPALEVIRSTFLGQALLGSHFSWFDFPFYLAGALAAALILLLVGGRSP